jgi:multisubunit Na+/H+ antiporter MnhB subunit
MTPRSVLLDRAVPVLYWLLLAAAVWILLRGHNAPGGGFIAGLVAVAASAALAIVLGERVARARLPLAPLPLAASGVLLALVSGLPALFSGHPYLMHFWGAPLEVKLSTVMLFDLGVFLAVWGALAGFVLALLAAGEEAA